MNASAAMQSSCSEPDFDLVPPLDDGNACETSCLGTSAVLNDNCACIVGTGR